MQKILSAYNLAAALRAEYTNIAVQVISQEIACATTEEQQALGINETNSWIREVYLQSDGVNLIHARVIAPYTTYQTHKQEFDTLGSKLLGESFIYQIPHTRSEFEYKRLNSMWSRSSIFNINSTKLLVIETFLAILDLPES